MSNQEQFKDIVETFKKQCESIGFYADHVSIGCDDPEKVIEAESEGVALKSLMENDEVHFGLYVEFSMRDYAFSDHVLDPEKVEIDKKFDMIVPDEYETFKKKGLGDLTDGF